MPSVEKRLKVQKEDGVLAHYPTVDLGHPDDGSFHDVDSNVMTRNRRRQHFARDPQRADSSEPVMKVGTVTPGDYLAM